MGEIFYLYNQPMPVSELDISHTSFEEEATGLLTARCLRADLKLGAGVGIRVGVLFLDCNDNRCILGDG